jgi:alginate O-acetyltransferase complex protein AlgI
VLFSDPVFLFAFLPLVVVVHALVPRWLGNAWLLVASLGFYAWGEGELVLVLAGSIGVNHLLGRALVRARGRASASKSSTGTQDAARDRTLVAFAVALNLGLLVLYKYAGWLLGGLGDLTGLDALHAAAAWAERRLTLPLGISFFTFQAISFLLDIRRGDAEAPRGPLDFGVYIALFPQLVAGPIVRYRDLADQLRTRVLSLPGFAEGVRRFVQGLAKKVLVADVLGAPADSIFALEPHALTPALAWTGCACYTLQIYFDFSGYSDMAIGIGRMLGFTLPENFRHPYASRSITEFWRRWHISLSTWFRDYLYVPLGGNRRGPLRTYTNLWIVFLVCGLWHGAAWTFVLWGVFHGALLVVERMGLGHFLARAPRVVAQPLTIALVMIGWVFFRADSLADARALLAAMFGLTEIGPLARPVALYLDRYELSTLGVGALLSLPLAPAYFAWRARTRPRSLLLDSGEALVTLGLALAAAVGLAAQTSTPFLYFRF